MNGKFCAMKGANKVLRQIIIDWKKTCTFSNIQMINIRSFYEKIIHKIWLIELNLLSKKYLSSHSLLTSTLSEAATIMN